MNLNDATASQAKPAVTATAAPMDRIRARPEGIRPPPGEALLTSAQDFVQKAAQDLVRVEMLLGQRSRGGGVRLVVGLDPCRSPRRSVERPEGNESLFHDVVAAEAGVLNERWLA